MRDSFNLYPNLVVRSVNFEVEFGQPSNSRALEGITPVEWRPGQSDSVVFSVKGKFPNGKQRMCHSYFRTPGLECGSVFLFFNYFHLATCLKRLVLTEWRRILMHSDAKSMVSKALLYFFTIAI